MGNNAKPAHAPYHFVPLSKWVYMPEWAAQVSHDVPFSDGLSGFIDLELTNLSPLCVGNQQVEAGDSAPGQVRWSKSPQGDPVIPGSSLKGMVRSVLEVATFGKFKAVDDQRLSYRDFSNTSTYREKIDETEVKAAWVRFNTKAKCWELRWCQWAQVEHDELNRKLSEKQDKRKSKQSREFLNNNDAKDEYKNWPLRKKVAVEFDKANSKGDSRWVKIAQKGSGQQGHLVFTGKRGKGKKKKDGRPPFVEYSYVFYDVSDRPERPESLGEQVAQMFASHDRELVEYLQKHQAPDLGIPVFVLIGKNSQAIEALGLARMPRMQYANSFKELLNNHSPAHGSQAVFDMAELVFGTLREHSLSLKGRVSFEDLRFDQSNRLKPEFVTSERLILNSPKPSFYPAYLEQPARVSKKDWLDYNRSEARLAGWKRYIAQTPHQNRKAQDQGQKEDKGKKNSVASQLELLERGQRFKGRLMFHNLRPVELGALLWTIQLGSEPGKHRAHSLGHGKPYGFGLVQFTPALRIKRGNQEHWTLDQLIAEFERHMNTQHPGADNSSWWHSPQIKYLLRLTDTNQNKGVDTRYMKLGKKQDQDNPAEPMGFQTLKSEGRPLTALAGPRQEQLAQAPNALVPAGLGCGRLSKLVESDWEHEQQRRGPEKRQDLERLRQEAERERQEKERQRKEEERKQQEEERQRKEEERKQQEEEARLNALPPCERLLEETRQQLEQQQEGNERRETIEKALEQFLAHKSEYLPGSARKLLDLARKHEFKKRPKKNKKKLKEQKELFGDVQQAYGLSDS